VAGCDDGSFQDSRRHSSRRGLINDCGARRSVPFNSHRTTIALTVLGVPDLASLTDRLFLLSAQTSTVFAGDILRLVRRDDMIPESGSPIVLLGAARVGTVKRAVCQGPGDGYKAIPNGDRVRIRVEFVSVSPEHFFFRAKERALRATVGFLTSVHRGDGRLDWIGESGRGIGSN
jgi:hypothetical protein